MSPAPQTAVPPVSVDHEHLPALSLSKWFAEEVHPHGPQLKAYVHRAFPAVRDVDDVVQECYFRIWKARAVHPIRSARAFLFRIARNIAFDLARRRSLTSIEALGESERLSVVDDKPNATEALTTAERVAILSDALDALPPRRREMVILCKLQGQSHGAVAARFGISEKTVAEHLYRGAQQLGEELARRGILSFHR